MKAWLVTWEWDGAHAKVRNRIVAILSPRRSSEYIRQFVEMTYANETYSLSERLAYAKNNRSNPYPAQWGNLGEHQWTGEVYCGHNPFLYARRVDDLRVESSKTGKEKLTWSERPKPEPLESFTRAEQL